MAIIQPKWKSKAISSEESLSFENIKSLGLSSSQVNELCFSMFLCYYVNSRMRNYEKKFSEELLSQIKNFNSSKKIDLKNLFKTKINEELYSFIGDSEKSFLIAQSDKDQGTRFKSLITEDFFNMISKGNGLNDSSLCSIKHLLLYKVSKSLEEKYDQKVHDFLSNYPFPECSPKSCEKCIKNLKTVCTDFFKDNSPEIFFGGKVIEILLPLKIIKMFVQNNSDYYQENKGLEKAFCDLLAFKISNNCQADYVTNDLLSPPNFCNEVDILISSGDKAMIIEITMQDNPTEEYIQNKIYNHYLLKQQFGFKELKTILFYMEKNSIVLKEVKNIKKEIREHIKYNSKEFSIIGYNDSLPRLNNEEYLAGGFLKIREIFNDLFNNLMKEKDLFFNK